MNINFTKEQYEDLLALVALAHSMNETLSDAVEDADIDYDERVDRSEALQSYLLGFADEAEMGEVMEISKNGHLYLSEDYYIEEIEPVLDDYEEFIVQDALPNILAWRDFNQDYTDEEQEKMAQKNGDFFLKELAPYEDYYINEFEKNGLARLFIHKNDDENGTPSPYL